MKERSVEVTAPSRLHFGMLSFGQSGERQYGGVGAMIDAPGIVLRISPAKRFGVTGPLAPRIRQFAELACSALDLPCEPRCHLELLAAPAEHVGLGTGTQLGLSVAAGLNAYLDRPPLEAVHLARMAGRGERSAIGTYGFLYGGLLVEAGKYEGDFLSPLVARVEMPREWRFLLIVPRDEQGPSGADEQAAFRDLPPVPSAATAALCREALMHLLPSAVEGHVEQFGESLYRYGHLAGLSFAANQGGPYASARLAQIVQTLRDMDVRGVAQSSWGPTIFALVVDEDAALRLHDILVDHPALADADLIIATPSAVGARIVVDPPGDRVQ